MSQSERLIYLILRHSPKGFGINAIIGPSILTTKPGIAAFYKFQELILNTSRKAFNFGYEGLEQYSHKYQRAPYTWEIQKAIDELSYELQIM